MRSNSKLYGANLSSIIIVLASLLAGCASNTPVPEPEISAYEQDINAWHQGRNERLNQPDGWLTLAGLFWLQEGENSFGSATENDLVFPGETVPVVLGSLILRGDSSSIQVSEGIQILLNGNPVETAGLKKDSSGEPDVMTWGTLSWYIIERGDRIGVRLKDAAHSNFVNFKPTELFPIKEDWQVSGTLEVFDSSRTVDIVNVLGDTSPNNSPGVLHFKINDQDLTLTPLADPDDESYFIIFGDATNGLLTYGAGRFLVIPAVDENGITTIDFNKSYNMPCAFSPYATCPLPPEENLLPIAIEAGERDYKLAHGHAPAH